MTKYVPLALVQLEEGAALAHHPELPELVYADDPAMSVVIDLAQEDFITIPADERFDSINRLMKISHILDFLVLEQKQLVGIISSRDLQGVKPTQICQRESIDRAQITAQMLMTPCDDIAVFNQEDLIHAVVGNVVTSLNQQHKHYALVVSKASESQTQIICGLIIGSRLRAQLNQEVSEII